MSITFTILSLVKHLGPFGVFWASVIDEIVVVVPSSLVHMAAGFFMLHGAPVTAASLVRLVTHIALPAALGVCVGSQPVYFLAFYGGEPAVRKFGKYFFLKWEHIERLHRRLDKKHKTFWLLALLRFIPGIPSVVISGFAGVIRARPLQYAGANFIGVFLRAFLLGALGWAIGGVYARVAIGLDLAVRTGIVVLLLGGAYAIWYRKKQKKRNRKAL